MASPATLLKHDVVSVVADNVESCLKPRTNFLMHMTILASNTNIDPWYNRAHQLIFGYSYKANSFALVLHHEGSGYLMAEMERVKGTVGIYKLELHTMHGGTHYIINADTQKTQFLFVNPGSVVNANRATFSFTDSTVFDPREMCDFSLDHPDDNDIESDSDSDNDEDLTDAVH